MAMTQLIAKDDLVNIFAVKASNLTEWGTITDVVIVALSYWGSILLRSPLEDQLILWHIRGFLRSF
jgi:hypothetical protein